MLLFMFCPAPSFYYTIYTCLYIVPSWIILYTWVSLVYIFSNWVFIALCFLWKRPPMMQLCCDCIIYFVFYFPCSWLLLYVTILGAISHTLCVYNGIHISHVFLPHLLYIYLFIYCEMKTNKLNWIEIEKLNLQLF